jgi:hypothetical protein
MEVAVKRQILLLAAMGSSPTVGCADPTTEPDDAVQIGTENVVTDETSPCGGQASVTDVALTDPVLGGQSAADLLATVASDFSVATTWPDGSPVQVDVTIDWGAGGVAFHDYPDVADCPEDQLVIAPGVTLISDDGLLDEVVSDNLAAVGDTVEVRASQPLEDIAGTLDPADHLDPGWSNDPDQDGYSAFLVELELASDGTHSGSVVLAAFYLTGANGAGSGDQVEVELLSW